MGSLQVSQVDNQAAVLKIVDLGSAQNSIDTACTSLVHGTLRYMAPEMLAAKQQTAGGALTASKSVRYMTTRHRMPRQARRKKGSTRTYGFREELVGELSPLESEPMA